MKNNKKKASDLLQKDNLSMEEKLQKLRKVIKIEKEKRCMNTKENKNEQKRNSLSKMNQNDKIMKNISNKNLNESDKSKKESNKKLQTLAEATKHKNISKDIINNDADLYIIAKTLNNNKQQNQETIYDTLETQININKYDEDEILEVKKFLIECKCEKYYDSFIKNGFDDLDVIMEIEEIHLDALKIPIGHKIKIIKYIKQIRNEKGIDNNNCEEDEIKDIHTNKINSHLELINDNIKEIHEKTENIDIELINNDDNKNSRPTIVSKVCCWHCYKLFNEKESFVKNKIQCSEPCYNKYFNLNTIKCCNNKCDKKILKCDGILNNDGKQYCSKKCFGEIDIIVTTSVEGWDKYTDDVDDDINNYDEEYYKNNILDDNQSHNDQSDLDISDNY